MVAAAVGMPAAVVVDALLAAAVDGLLAEADTVAGTAGVMPAAATAVDFGAATAAIAAVMDTDMAMVDTA
jgi:hypothetical protein